MSWSKTIVRSRTSTVCASRERDVLVLLPRLPHAGVESTAVTRRERIAFMLAHYSDVLAGVRDRGAGRRVPTAHGAGPGTPPAIRSSSGCYRFSASTLAPSTGQSSGMYVYPHFVRRAVCPNCGLVKPPQLVGELHGHPNRKQRNLHRTHEAAAALPRRAAPRRRCGRVARRALARRSHGVGDLLSAVSADDAQLILSLLVWPKECPAPRVVDEWLRRHGQQHTLGSGPAKGENQTPARSEVRSA
jgi:hypothetical protein